MWPFKRKLSTNYPPQVIPPKPLELIHLMDDWHTNHNNPIGDKSFYLEEVVIPLSCQHWSLDKIFQPSPSTDSYIPRSIAFYITPNGDWVFLVGLFRTVSDTELPNMTMQRMWLELLTRTNNARNM